MLKVRIDIIRPVEGYLSLKESASKESIKRNLILSMTKSVDALTNTSDISMKDVPY